MTIFVDNDGVKVEIPGNDDLMKNAKIFGYPHHTASLVTTKLEAMSRLCEIPLGELLSATGYTKSDFPEKFYAFTYNVYDIMFNYEFSVDETDKLFAEIIS